MDTMMVGKMEDGTPMRSESSFSLLTDTLPCHRAAIADFSVNPAGRPFGLTVQNGSSNAAKCVKQMVKKNGLNEATSWLLVGTVGPEIHFKAIKQVRVLPTDSLLFMVL